MTTRTRNLFLVALALLVAAAALFFGLRHTPSADAPPARVQRLAQFGDEAASADARRLANWVADSRDNKTMSFVILDKKDAKVFLFDRDGVLKSWAPALLGSALGDHTVPGIGDKPIAQVLPEERTTPAGRFIAEVGESSSRGEDVVWIDYDAAVSMHRVIKVPERLASLESPTPTDNRMSYGCVNLPQAFYEQKLRPAVDKGGLVVYVLPDTRSLVETFASFYDVSPPASVAQN